MVKTIGLQVHVDTFEGMRRGVPRLLDLFRKHSILSSFFVPMGKDHTGWTAKRVFTRKGFLKKAGRAGVLSTYGLKTLMYGLVLPGPEIAKRNLPVIKEIIDMGHELGIHGFDHVYWHDHIKHMGQEQTHAILRKAVGVYRECVGSKPVSFAAPGWMINAHALAFFENNGFLYSSDTRGRTPFLPVMAGKRFTVMQLPSTLPTLDEMVGLEGNDDVSLADYFLGCLTDGLNILSVHTELEGNRRTAFLDLFIQHALDRGHRFLPLIEIARTVKDRTDLPSCECVYGSIRGRAGEVTLQSGACLS